MRDSLFDEPISAAPEYGADAPLAARMRPRTLEEFVGQESVVGPGTLLRRAIENDQLTSAIFWVLPYIDPYTMTTPLSIS